jgi:hypothetical protein
MRTEDAASGNRSAKKQIEEIEASEHCCLLRRETGRPASVLGLGCVPEEPAR